MSLGSIVMQYLRKGKRSIDQALVGIDSIAGKKQLEKLKQGEYYGFVGGLVEVDQLGTPDPNLVESYYGKINDLEAALRFGTSDLEQYSYWSWRSCGVANIAAIMKTAGVYEGNLYQLIVETVNSGGYLESNRWGESDIGWKHESLKNILLVRGIEAELSPRLSIEGLLALVSKGAMIIASMKSRLREGGSHMVVVTGFQYDGDDSIISVYDPYTLDGEGGRKAVSLQEFAGNYLNRGIITWPLTNTTVA